MEPCNVIARASRRIGSWEPWCNVHDRNPMDCIAELEASLSAEKASGKNGLCPDCGYVRWDCRCLAEALKRIAELEAELEALVQEERRRKEEVISKWNQESVRVKELEAELAEMKKVEQVLGPLTEHEALELQKERFALQEALRVERKARVKAEAEVERLQAYRRLDSLPAAPSGVSPSPPLPDCAVCGLSLAEHMLTPNGNQAWREGHWFQKAAARKERDDG